MGKRFSDRIIEFIQRPGYEPIKARRLARAMGIADAQYGDFHDAVDALRRVGRVVLGTNNAVMLPHPPGQLIGTYRSNPRGFGFVVPEAPTSHGDLYIAQGNARDAITGDKVLCSVLRRGKRGGKQLFGGQIVRVIERGHSQFVGRLRQEGKLWYVETDGHVLHAPVLIGDPKAKSARADDQVVVEITRYPADGEPARGVIIERLGEHGAPGVDLLSVIRQFHLPEEFPADAVADARRAISDFDPEAAGAKREDLSGCTIITIDPDDARDFDDAISLEQLAPPPARTTSRKRGKRRAGPAVWELGVHIADVSAFVRAGSPLDNEAEKRGTSVYFPGHVLPMLPEVLSNGVCSLQENEPRLCKSAFIRYDAEANVVDARFANTRIRSAKRLTYTEAQSIIDGRQPRVPKPVIQLVKRMETLARAIRARRLARGMIVLDLPEVALVLDDEGRVADAQPEDRSFSHTVIEMFMVEANEAVARRLAQLNVPFLRRVHPEPDDESLEAMARFVQMIGEKLPGKIEPRDLQRLLGKLRDRPEGYAVNLAVLKSMQMAEYSPESIGHFALASDEYAHFTSPIRRYPDLMVHRLLELDLQRRLKPAGGRRHKQDGAILGHERLVEYGKRMSYLARRAESAERELKEVKVLTLLAGHVSEAFEGVITGVTNFGLFVQHPKYLIDGLLRIEDLGDDWWETDVKRGRVVGERSRTAYSLGTRVTVQIASVDIASRELSLSLAGKQPAAKALNSTARRMQSSTRPNNGRKAKELRSARPRRNRRR